MFSKTIRLLLASCLCFPASWVFADTYELDSDHSRVGFSVQHLLISQVHGQFNQFEGQVTMGKKQRLKKVSAVIDAASIDTRHQKRDSHLKQGDFLEVAKFPEITFESTSIKKRRNQNYLVTGDLTIRGVTKEVSLKGKMLGMVDSKEFGKRIGFTAKGQISRKDFGMVWNETLDTGDLLVGDMVELTIDAELVMTPDEASVSSSPQ